MKVTAGQLRNEQDRGDKTRPEEKREEFEKEFLSNVIVNY